MRKKVFKSDVDSLREEGLKIVQDNEVSRYYFKVSAVNAVLSGHSSLQVCKWFGVSSRTLNGWVKKVDEYGFEALKDKPRPGAPSKLSKEQLAEIDRMIQGSPGDYDVKVWDGPSLSAVIKRQFGIKLGVRQCQRLFHKLGFSRIRPQTYPSKDSDNDEEREAFQKKRLR
jgi:transposase